MKWINQVRNLLPNISLIVGQLSVNLSVSLCARDLSTS